jgi:hypothetical protein
LFSRVSKSLKIDQASENGEGTSEHGTEAAKTETQPSENDDEDA